MLHTLSIQTRSRLLTLGRTAAVIAARGAGPALSSSRIKALSASASSRVILHLAMIESTAFARAFLCAAIYSGNSSAGTRCSVWRINEVLTSDRVFHNASFTADGVMAWLRAQS